MAQKFKRKKLVEAIQWNGDNVIEVLSFVQAIILSTAPAGNGQRLLYLNMSNCKERLEPGCWLVKDEYDSFEVWQDDQFRSDFEPIV
jgi:hypothetical protein